MVFFIYVVGYLIYLVYDVATEGMFFPSVSLYWFGYMYILIKYPFVLIAIVAFGIFLYMQDFKKVPVLKYLCRK